MALSLISPVGDNFIKDFPGQNAVNCSRIDEFAGPSLITNDLTSYSPALGAVTTNPGLGTTGFVRGFYYQIFDQVYVWAEFRFSTGLSAGSGTYTMSLPFTMDTSINPPNLGSMGSVPPIGNGVIWDNDTIGGRQPVVVIPRSRTAVHFGLRMNNGSGSRAVDHQTPLTWAAGDGITWSARYKRLV